LRLLWDAILRTNLLGTEFLLDAIEPLLNPGTCAVLIASIAGHRAPAEPEIDAILAAPRAADLLQRMQPHLQRLAGSDARDLGGLAYALSKRAVIRLVEARAAAWAAKGARIVSISPGTIWTPMGRKSAQDNTRSARVVAATPIGRWGKATDIASAAAFLASEDASFITGCDLRIDGGVTPALEGVTF
jgi:NAD(P)-dependent dehydrogenase (short-subunit alcohol dehydrogenase family)